MKPAKLSLILFSLAMLLCAARPLIFPIPAQSAKQIGVTQQNWAFDHWNTSKRTLYQLPLTPIEKRFAIGFPGYIGRFSDGNTVWVVRHISHPTRMLHAASDCYRGLGYKVSNPRVVSQANNARWRCFTAERQHKLQVCERIFDNNKSEWTDVSAWYWETLFESGKHEWWAVTQVNRIETTDNTETRLVNK